MLRFPPPNAAVFRVSGARRRASETLFNGAFDSDERAGLDFANATGLQQAVEMLLHAAPLDRLGKQYGVLRAVHEKLAR
jgi:hypothetical protein